MQSSIINSLFFITQIFLLFKIFFLEELNFIIDDANVPARFVSLIAFSDFGKNSPVFGKKKNLFQKTKKTDQKTKNSG
ncbi:MAG: hypothetical protein ACI9XO_004173 [Paraglaciecola sp.]